MLDPRAFGTRESVRWKPVRTLSKTELDNLIAAQVHHLVAYRIQLAIRRTGLTREEAAVEYGMGENRLGRLLRGEVVMRLEDIAWADRTFKLGVLAALFPSGDDEMVH